MAETTDVNESSSTDAIRRDIRGTEREMSETIHEIEDRLSPKHVAQRSKDSMRRAGVKVFDRIKRNPIGLAMAGVGLWLFFRSSGAESESDVRQYASTARGKASELASKASEKSERWRGVARQKMQGARDFYDRQPLVVGLVAFAVGAVVAAIIPESEREDALLGDTRDRLLDRATEAARERVDRVREVAKEEGQRIAETAAGRE